MIISAIVALSENRVIGKDNAMPWHLPADLRHFKEITLGKPIIMGRKTFLSIGRALPHRLNVVITSDTDFQAAHCTVVHSIEEAMTAVSGREEIMVIGGRILFEQMLPQVSRLYLTIIHAQFEGDVFFPEIKSDEWREVSHDTFKPDAENAYAYSFITLHRTI